MNSSGEKICPDCGPDPVNHASLWLESATEDFFQPIDKLANAIFRLIKWPFILLPMAKMAWLIFRILNFLKIGSFSRELYSDDNLRTRALWESAQKKNIELWQFRIANQKHMAFFIASKNGRWHIFENVPRPAGLPCAWMDNKATLKKKFRLAGLPTAAGGATSRLKIAKKIFQKIAKPAIVKPHLGSRSRHTFTEIKTEEDLIKAFRSAKKVSPIAVVEEQLPGFVFRATLINGRLAGVIRREAAHIIGNGKNTVAELLEKENRRPERQGPIFHTIPKNEDADNELVRQGRRWEDVPATGEMVFLQPKVSRAVGASTTDVTENTHPANIAIFEKAAAVVNDSLIGFDFIIEDISRSWSEQKCGFIEANSAPFVDLHHYPLFGQPRDAAGILWDLIFPD